MTEGNKTILYISLFNTYGKYVLLQGQQVGSEVGFPVLYAELLPDVVPVDIYGSY